MGNKKILVMSTNGILRDGITSWLIATYGAMDLTGLEVSTIAFEGADNSVVDEVKAAGVEVVVLPHRRKDMKAYRRAFSELLQSKCFDAIHVCCNSALAVLELEEAKKRVVRMRIAHSRNTMCSHRVANFLLNPLFQSCITDRYACGHDAGVWLFGKRSFTVIPNGKNLSEYSFSIEAREAVRAELGLSADVIAFGHVGGFNEQKNHAKLIEVFSELRNRGERRHLFLIGEGYTQDAVKTQVEQLGISDCVHFLGRRNDVLRLLNAMDCMVFPSLYEGFPNVVLEWQLNGLPVVMSDVITDECAITPLVRQLPLAADAAEWADAVERSMAGRSRATDSAAAQQAAKVAGYDINENAAMLRRLYLDGVERCK
jgi:glycosyltransferase involved in cell wall biosynthesis